MKTKLWLIVMVTVLFTLSSSQSIRGDEYYDIRLYDVAIEVDNGNNYHITETITVEFYSPRHGIYRDIPTIYNDIQHPIKNIQVMNPETGKDYGTQVTRSNGVVSIQIGDEDIYVDGIMTYAISYTYMGGMDFDTDMDEFYFNIIGSEWDATIDHVTFQVKMPNTFDSQNVNITSGTYGSTDTSNLMWNVSGTTITGETLSPIYGHNVTVALPLEEGYYSEVSPTLNLVGLYAFLIVVLSIAAFAFYKNRELKRDNVIVPVVSFEPPSGLNAAEVAYIYNRENCSSEDLSSLILSWASLGCLTINEVKKKILGSYLEFNKVADLPTYLPKYESQLFKAMFRHGNDGTVTTNSLANKFYSDLAKASEGLRKKFKGDQEIMVNKVQWLSKLYAILYMLFYSVGFGIVANSLVHNGFISSFVPALICGVVLTIGVSIIASVFKKGASALKIILTFVASLLVIAVIALIYTLSFSRLFNVLSWQTPNAIRGLIVTNIVYIFGLWFMVSSVQYTDYAKKILGHIEGFREFLKVAKTDQIAVHFESNPNYIYDILPFAMVLGLTNIWEKHVTALSVASPYWYHSTTAFNAGHMTRSFSNSFSAAATAPSSSGSGGSSGGGFSGGGGGGGGGGSW